VVGSHICRLHGRRAAGLDYRVCAGRIVGFALAAAGRAGAWERAWPSGRSELSGGPLCEKRIRGPFYLAGALFFAYSQHWMRTDRVVAFAGEQAASAVRCGEFGGRAGGSGLSIHECSCGHYAFTPLFAGAELSYRHKPRRPPDYSPWRRLWFFDLRCATMPTDTRSELGCSSTGRSWSQTGNAVLRCVPSGRMEPDGSATEVSCRRARRTGASFIVQRRHAAEESALTSAGCGSCASERPCHCRQVRRRVRRASQTYAGTGTVRRYVW